MANKKLSIAEWAKVRIDREVKGLSFHVLAGKYGVSSATIYRRAQKENWTTPDSSSIHDDTDNETVIETPSDIDNKGIKPDCLSENETNETKRPKTKRNETEKETSQSSKTFDTSEYVSRLISQTPDTRARTSSATLHFELEQIDKQLTDLIGVIDNGGFTGKYRPEFARIAYHIALLGGTQDNLATLLNVHVDTIRDWLAKYPEFHLGWHGGKDFADSQVVKGLYKRAVGYSVTVTDFKSHKGQLEEVEKTIVYPPDPVSGMFWLKNRQPHLWKDKVEVVEEITASIVDQDESDAFYEELLQEAAHLKQSFVGRAERLNLVLDGDAEE